MNIECAQMNGSYQDEIGKCPLLDQFFHAVDLKGAYAKVASDVTKSLERSHFILFNSTRRF